MGAARAALTEMAKFVPKEPREDYRLPLRRSVAADLEQVARIRTKVNKRVGDGTKISVTEMLLGEADELREESFAEWGGKPVDEAAEDVLVEQLVKVYSEPPQPAPHIELGSVFECGDGLRVKVIGAFPNGTHRVRFETTAKAKSKTSSSR
jgi:hypothetical protein